MKVLFNFFHFHFKFINPKGGTILLVKGIWFPFLSPVRALFWEEDGGGGGGEHKCLAVEHEGY